MDQIELLLKELASILPSIKMPKLSLTGVKSNSTKIPGINQASKKNPVKSAEQISNKDIKDIKLREAQDQLKINKSTGQWSL